MPSLHNMEDIQTIDIDLPKVVGKGYASFWDFTGRYRVVKGGRGSKKSTTSALWFIYNMMEYYHEYDVKPNTLVLRRYYNTHRNSTYAQLRWAMKKLNVEHLWHCTLSPMEMTYKPSGQKILFRGLDDPQSVTSITVDEGHLCWTWWEEAFQITNEDDFNKIDLSIRGELPEPLFKQHTLIMNPWSDKIWIKSRFFDEVEDNGYSPGGDIMAITRNYDCNEFLGIDDIELFENMKVKNPRRYSIEGLGNWGVAEGLVYENVTYEDFNPQAIYDQKDRYGKRYHRLLFGLDFGFTNDPTAFTALLVDEKNYKIYVFDEVYDYGMSNLAIYKAIKRKGYDNDLIWADSAEARTISELRTLGLGRIKGVKKYAGSVEEGVQVLQDYEIICHTRCAKTSEEFGLYVFAKDKKTGKLLNKPEDEFNHAMDAIRYATCKLKRRSFTFVDEHRRRN